MLFFNGYFYILFILHKSFLKSKLKLKKLN